MERAETTRRHESVDHVNPTDAGLMHAEGDDVPGTGIMGDETVVRDLDDGRPPGIYPAPPAHTGGVAHPGPTPAAVGDAIETPADHRRSPTASTEQEGA